MRNEWNSLGANMANSGVTAPELCAFFGWANLREAQTYIEMAESEQRSFAARKKLKVTKKQCKLRVSMAKIGSRWRKYGTYEEVGDPYGNCTSRAASKA